MYEMLSIFREKSGGWLVWKTFWAIKRQDKFKFVWKADGWAIIKSRTFDHEKLFQVCLMSNYFSTLFAQNWWGQEKSSRGFIKSELGGDFRGEFLVYFAAQQTSSKNWHQRKV